eukprot:15479312-Alexandrium_andersonii.AAC.1
MDTSSTTARAGARLAENVATMARSKARHHRKGLHRATHTDPGQNGSADALAVGKGRGRMPGSDEGHDQVDQPG